MRKSILMRYWRCGCAFLVIFVIFNLTITGAFAANEVSTNSDITVMLNGEKLEFTDAKPYIKSGRVLVPFRKIFEAFGMNVSWNGTDRTILASNDRTKIFLRINDTTAYINDLKKSMDVAPEIKGSRTFVPLRFIGESVSADVQWDNSTKTVTILLADSTNSTGKTSVLGDIRVSLGDLQVDSLQDTIKVNGTINVNTKKIYVYLHNTPNDYILIKAEVISQEGEVFKFKGYSFVPSVATFKTNYIEVKILNEEGKLIKVADFKK